jgi:hypothetical protein
LRHRADGPRANQQESARNEFHKLLHVPLNTAAAP